MTGTRSPRQVVLDYIQAMNEADWERLRSVLHPDVVEDFPQSGERIRGVANAIAVRSHVPRTWRNSIDRQRVVGGDDAWALGPNFTAIKVAADGDVVTSIVRARYPDGYWFVVNVAEIQGGLIRHATVYFAPTFDPPEWRREWVERLPEDEPQVGHGGASG